MVSSNTCPRKRCLSWLRNLLRIGNVLIPPPSLVLYVYVLHVYSVTYGSVSYICRSLFMWYMWRVEGVDVAVLNA